MRADFRHWVRVPTRFRDVDPMRHVNSTVYFVYFETARLDYFTRAGLHEFRDGRRTGPAVVSQTCNYRRQVFHPSVIDVGIRLADVGNRSFTIEYELYLEGTDELVADGKTVMAWVDYRIAKAVPLPDELRRAIREFEAAGRPIG